MNVRTFRKVVWDKYQSHGRTFPWRETRDPYHILVSEFMLQQTQVERVAEKYATFIEKFPTVADLARATLREVLFLWQGLGYNRRAKMLHETAKHIVKEHRGKVPHQYRELLALPGIGPYTAGAICAFAYSQPIPCVETNIRTVFLHHFFRGKESVSDKEVLTYVERSLMRSDPRTWYYALMDYGTVLKKKRRGINTKSKHYFKQSAFRGSDREIRGTIIRTLLERTYTVAGLTERLREYQVARVREQLLSLHQEGLIAINGAGAHAKRLTAKDDTLRVRIA